MQQVIARISQLLSQGKALKAEQELHLLLLKDPHNEDLQAMLGHTLLKQSKSNEAIKVFLTNHQPQQTRIASLQMHYYLQVKQWKLSKHLKRQ